MGKIQNNHWKNVVYETKERLHKSIDWFPFPILIGVCFTFVFSWQVLFSINSRLDTPALPVELEATQSPQGAIWIGIIEKNSETILITEDKKIFRWPTEKPSLANTKPFVEYLKSLSITLALSAVLADKILYHQTMVTLSVDRNLSYKHIRPIIYALAQAGIARYAFEVKKPLL